MDVLTYALLLKKIKEHGGGGSADLTEIKEQIKQLQTDTGELNTQVNERAKAILLPNDFNVDDFTPEYVGVAHATGKISNATGIPDSAFSNDGIIELDVYDNNFYIQTWKAINDIGSVKIYSRGHSGYGSGFSDWYKVTDSSIPLDSLVKITDQQATDSEQNNRIEKLESQIQELSTNKDNLPLKVIENSITQWTLDTAEVDQLLGLHLTILVTGNKDILRSNDIRFVESQTVDYAFNEIADPTAPNTSFLPQYNKKTGILSILDKDDNAPVGESIKIVSVRGFK